MTRTAALAAVVAAALAACKPAASPAPSQGGAATGTPAAAAPGAAAAFVTAAAAVRREPTEAPRVKGADGKETSNFVATLQRGEQVAVVEAREDWTRIRTSDDKEGWLKASAVLQGEGLAPATVLAPADVFDRPDLLAANAKRKLDPGTLLLVVKNRPPFSEVNVSGATTAWVLTERLATGEREVSVAKLVEKARWLVRSKKADDAKQILALAREHFAGVPLVDVLAQELGEAPPPAEGGVQPIPTSMPGTAAPP